MSGNFFSQAMIVLATMSLRNLHRDVDLALHNGDNAPISLTAGMCFCVLGSDSGT